MSDEYDFKAALDGYGRGKANGDLTTWFSINEKLFIKALRIADRLQSGEVSEGMYKAFRDTWIERDRYFNKRKRLQDQFKAMATQLMKEVSDV